MRGKPSFAAASPSVTRITPAGAGKTEYYAFPDEETGDHPRRCGENDAVGVARAFQPGITPAGAGKTPMTNLCRSTRQDHPRRCGENYLRKAGRGCAEGSPPQVRGKLSPYSLDRTAIWITPAGAGKTFTALGEYRDRQDHPRRCGENKTIRRRCRPLPGSPPQVRGKQPCQQGGVCRGGITPAGAGKTRRN